jgi:hypothetical protein
MNNLIKITNQMYNVINKVRRKENRRKYNIKKVNSLLYKISFAIY